MSKPRKTLAQMAQEAAGQSQPMQIGGKPADVCPYCGCGLFVAKRMPGDKQIVRYVECRNPNCGKRFLSSQPPPPPARLLREVGGDDEDNSISGKRSLTLHKESA